ncbi:helix-turn-helix domain-containing protein [Azospirillum palustre]|uniref:helix-turn-helix domain-containing protein n=1 Tax=Azospirillum palustre TaxID=2044885 RepID=UPI003CC7CCC8
MCNDPVSKSAEGAVSKPIRAIDELPDLATPAEVAEVLRCSSRFVSDECKKGRMGATYVAGRYLIAPADVRTYLAERAVTRSVPTVSSARPIRRPPLLAEQQAHMDNERNERALRTVEKLKAIAKR